MNNKINANEKKEEKIYQKPTLVKYAKPKNRITAASGIAVGAGSTPGG